MTRPTDDELEAMAARLDQSDANEYSYDNDKEQAAAMLRAMKVRGNDCLIEFDNGEKISLSSFSGGAAPEGIMGSITLIKEDEDGKATFRAYKSVTDWQSGLQARAALEPAPDHSDWNAAIEAAAQVGCSADTVVFENTWTDGQCAAAISAMQSARRAIRALKKGPTND